MKVLELYQIIYNATYHAIIQMFISCKRRKPIIWFADMIIHASLVLLQIYRVHFQSSIHTVAYSNIPAFTLSMELPALYQYILYTVLHIKPVYTCILVLYAPAMILYALLIFLHRQLFPPSVQWRIDVAHFSSIDYVHYSDEERLLLIP